MLEDKALVQVNVPAVGDIYDIYIPLDVTMYKVNKLVKRCVRYLAKDKYIPNDESCLINADSGVIYNQHLFVDELDIKNGTTLILI